MNTYIFISGSNMIIFIGSWKCRSFTSALVSLGRWFRFCEGGTPFPVTAGRRLFCKYFEIYRSFPHIYSCWLHWSLLLCSTSNYLFFNDQFAREEFIEQVRMLRVLHTCWFLFWFCIHSFLSRVSQMLFVWFTFWIYSIEYLDFPWPVDLS